MQLAPITKKVNNLLEVIADKQDIKWTNRYDCPPAYHFNEDGWVETALPYPKITVTLLPYLQTRLGTYNFLLQNLIALRLLNDKSHAELVLALKNRYKQAFFGHEADRKVFDEVVIASELILDTTQLPPLCQEIFSLETIWYSRDCNEDGKAGIKKVIRNNYITTVRNFMPINAKYKTNMVMKEAEVSEYAVDLYWKSLGLDPSNRTISAIIEAVNELSDSDIKLDYKMIAEVAGLSVRSIQRYKNMWMLNEK